MKTNKTNEHPMQQDEIYELVATQLSDALTAYESRRLNEWIVASEANRKEYSRLVEVWNSTPDVSQLSQYDRHKAFAMFLERIQASGVVPAAKAAGVVAADDADDVQPEAIGMRRYVLRFMRYAAVVTVLVCACSYLFYNIGQRNMSQAFAMIKVEAPQGSTTKMTLPDGTKVWLNAGSLIEYSQGFGVNDRHVQLTGEGYFEVHRNESMPFIVKSPSLNVQVLGTKFDFRDYPSDHSAMVSLDEGSVAVGLRSAHDGDYQYRLAPDQRAVLEKRSGNMRIENRSTTDRLWTDGTIMINGQRLADIAIDLERSYGTRICIESTELAQTRFYGVFHRKDQSLDQVLATLAATGHMRYAINGNVVRIYK
ncbi:FecR family protein [Prevotella sp.]|uniref:FecR family protein n=1 Tax=Prevotella sp. TaxID=59823 RepID=UPI0025E37E4D|nr:FecR domain-containing protein [Prevotella sp.]MCI7372363.1 FecR domain-containing protein [Prevotella sp.]